MYSKKHERYVNPNKPRKPKRHLTPSEEQLIIDTYNSSSPKVGINENYDVVKYDSPNIIHTISAEYTAKKINGIGTHTCKKKLHQYRSSILDYIAEYRGFATLPYGSTTRVMNRTTPLSEEEKKVIKDAFEKKQPAEYSVNLAIVPYASIRGFNEISIPSYCKTSSEYEDYIVKLLARDVKKTTSSHGQSTRSYIRESLTGDSGY